MNASGPDEPAIQCYTPDGCCGPSACDVTEEDFICKIRALLPEGQIYNNTALASRPGSTAILDLGTITICDNKIGCEQLIFGGCCEQISIPCDDDPALPQLALIDAFAAVGFSAVEALCVLLRELDPCTAQLTIRQWAQRYGIEYPDPCAGTWSDEVLALLICLMWRIRFRVRNWDYLTELAAFFGAQMVMHYAGDMNCGPLGWWTMARDAAVCPPKTACPDEVLKPQPELIPLVPTCYSVGMSLNIVMWPGQRVLPANCNLPSVPSPQPHDPELYEVWKWLLPQLLPPGPLYCIYQRDPANCIT